MGKLRKILPLMCIPAMLLASCDDGTSASAWPPLIDGKTYSDSTAVTGLEDALTKLKAVDNYHTVIMLTDGQGGQGYYYEGYFTENYMFYDNGDESYGYAQKDGKTFRLGQTGDSEIVSSEAIKNIDSLWGSGLFAAFEDIDVAKLATPTEKETVVTDKINKLAVLELLNFDGASYYHLLESATLKVGNTLSTFEVNIDLGLRNYVLMIDEINNTSNQTIESFLETNGAYELPLALEEIKSGFAGMDFVRDVLDYTDINLSYGYEHFTPDYYIGIYNENGAAVGAFNQGYVGMNHMRYLDDPSGQDLYGTYTFLYQNREISFITTYPYHQSPAFYKEVIEYPTYMDIWGKLEYALPTENENEYVVTDEALIDNFAENNQVKDLLASQGFTATKLLIKVTGVGTIDLAVTFDLHYTSGANDNVLRYKFQEFGRSSIEALDTFFETKFVPYTAA